MCWVLGRRTTPKWWQSTWHTSTSSYIIGLMAEIHCIPHPTHWQWKKWRFTRDTAEDPRNEQIIKFTDIMGLGYTQCISKSFLEESPCQSHCDTYSYTTCDLDITASRMEFVTGPNRLTILRHFLERSGEARERSSSQFHSSPSLWAFLQTETSPKVRGFPMLPVFGGIPSGTPSRTKK